MKRPAIIAFGLDQESMGQGGRSWSRSISKEKSAGQRCDPEPLGLPKAGLRPRRPLSLQASLLGWKALSDSHDDRHHRGGISVHERYRGVAQLRIHVEICGYAGCAAVMADDVFSIE